MSTQSFKVKSGLTISPVDLTTLTNPQAGDLACDVNDSNKIKRYDANSSAWTEVGSGGVGGTDIFFVQDFESASLSTFTQTGLTLTQTDPLHGKVSALLTHQAGVSPTNDQSFKQVIPVDRKFRGETMTLRLNAKSNASAGNVTINIYDETNAANIVASEQLELSNDTSGAISRVGFTIPESCASISYTITALPEAGSPVSRIDDIICELASTALLETAVEVPVVTSWQGYTPTFQGFGTPTNVEFEWRQVGENVEIRGKFTSGTPTAVEARVGLPAGLTSAGTGIIPSIQVAGKFANPGTAPTYFGSSVLIEPSVTYLTFGIQTSTVSEVNKANANSLLSSGQTGSFFASVPCAGLSALSTKTIPLTQSGLVQGADTFIRLTGSTSNGSTATAIPRFTTLERQLGSSVLYQDSATNGNSFTILEDGVYSFSGWLGCNASLTNYDAGLSLNASNLTTTVGNLSLTELLAVGRDNVNTAATTTKVISFAWTGRLSAGDVVRVHGTTSAPVTGGITVTREGSLKQVSVSSDQKIAIPTSELRFEGASSRGSTATAIVKFDTLAKIRGDAFTVTNTAADGTYVTMNKAGRLSVSASLVATAANVFITLNQSVLTSIPSLASETLAADVTDTNQRVSLAWSGYVKVGDVIRISSGATPTANFGNSLNLSFQEQDISVSVTNTLPQFSESDSCVQLSGANGYGSTATTTRRFASVVQNIGSDIEYVDSATLGGQFTAKSAGIYHVIFSESSTATVTTSGVAVNVNGTTVSISRDTVNTASGTAKQTTASWSGYLNQGDIVTASVQVAASNDGNQCYFVMSKVGKPNVTGVDVTSFVNVPQPESQSSILRTTTPLGVATLTGALTVQKGSSSLYSYNSSTGIYTALKRINLAANFTLTNSTTSGTQASIWVNGIGYGYDAATPSTGFGTQASFSGILEPGDTWYFTNGNSTSSVSIATVLATALSDQILTAPETFSTDTAALAYSSTYTLSTLNTAPVGTYITFTYAANTNTRTQTSTRPTQTDADMNANGILIYTRAYNAASTSGNPSAIAIQIGKGLKGRSLDLYKSAGKVTPGQIDFHGASGVSAQYGMSFKDYNELTGVLVLDAGYCPTTAITNYQFLFSDITSQTSGYLVINASKNPALTGLGIKTVAARVVSTSGQSIPNTGINIVTWDANPTYDTAGAMNPATGVFTAPESGYYQVSFNVYFNTATYAIANTIQSYLYKNGVNYSYGRLDYAERATTYDFSTGGSSGVYLNKGDTLDVRVANNRTAGATTLATGGVNYFSVHKTSIGTGN